MVLCSLLVELFFLNFYLLKVSLCLGQVLLGMCKHRMQPFKVSKMITSLVKFSCSKREWLQFKICILSFSLLKTIIRHFILGARRLGLLIFFLSNPHVSKSEFRHIYLNINWYFQTKLQLILLMLTIQIFYCAVWILHLCCI